LLAFIIRIYHNEWFCECQMVRWIFKKWNGVGMVWIDLAEDRDRWRALVNAVMNLQVP